MKKKILGLTIFLFGIVPTLAADVAPLTFGKSASEDQEYWESLMKYKMWGSHGITFNKEKVYISETSGYSGTADGDVTLNNGYHSLGGPFLVGGNLVFSYPSAGVDYDSLYGGPVRVLGNLKLAQWYNATGTIYEGDYCIQGTAEATAGLNDGLARWVSNAHKKGNVYASFAGADASYESCPPNVPKVDTHLSVPEWPIPASASFDAGVVLTEGYAQTAYLDVPPILSENENEVFDRYIKEFTLKNNEHKYVYIRMPSKAQNYNHKNGRLTRFYVADGINIDKSVNSGIIQVVYVNEDATWNTSTKSWDNFNSSTAKYVPNKEYAGNVMFYTTKDITWEPLIAPSYQGTFMTTGTFRIEDHFVLAGQLVANNLWFESEITGDFRYVPFDPPVIDINPEARSWGVLKEGVSSAQALSVSLTEAPLTDVSFDYCYEFSGSQANNKLTDPDSSHAFASLDDVLASELPICNNNGENGTSTVKNTVHFEKGNVSPNESVLIRVANDSDEEWTEFFTIRIFNLLGAVLPNNERDGKFLIEIDDDDKAPKGKDTVFVAVEDEDSPFVKFPATTGSNIPLNEYQIKIESLPKNENGVVVGTFTYDNAAVTVGQIISSADIGKLVYHGEENAFGDNKASFTYSVIANDVISRDPNTVTINISAVNDAPVVSTDTIRIGEVDHVVQSGSITASDIDIGDALSFYFDKVVDATFTEANYNKIMDVFAMDPATGEISVIAGKELNYESIDSLFKIRVKVFDDAYSAGGVGNDSAYAELVIKVIDQNEAPVVRDTTFSVNENSPAGTEVGQLEAFDPDIKNPHYGTLTFTIDENEDANNENDVPFAIASDGTITVSEDGKLDFETQPTWVIHVTVTDGFLPQTVEVVINLNDLNEPPVVVDVKESYDVVENTENAVVFATIKIVDVDAADGANTLAVTLIDKNSSAASVSADQLFDASIIAGTGDTMLVKIFVSNSNLLDYEALYRADPVSYDVTLSITDANGAANSFTIPIDTKILVIDQNEVPTAEDGEFTVAENAPKGTVIDTVRASDPDIYNATYGTLYYTLVGSSDRYEVEELTGAVKVKENAKIDYETTPNHKDTIYVQVTDKGTEPQIAKVVITITDENENPELACVAGDVKCNGPFDVFENSKKDSVIHEFAFVDVDAGDRGLLTTSLTDVNGRGADTLFTTVFSNDSSVVKLVVKKGLNLDYETLDASYTVVITVQDDEGLNDTLIREINLVDVNEAPVMANKNFTPNENIQDGDVVGSMVVTEPDVKNEEFRHLDFAIITPNVPFVMDSNEVKVLDASKLNYEIDSVFTFKVEVRNCEKNSSTGLYTEKCLADTADVKVTLQDVNENPDIKCLAGDANCNGPFSVAENSATGFEIHPFAISDVDAKDSGKLTASLSDNGNTGADSLFDVRVSATNDTVYIVVKDKAKLDFEKIKAEHEVVITVRDDAGLTDTLIRTINVTDVNEAPDITNNSFTPDENLTNGALVGEMVATDPDTKNVEFRHLDFAIITPNMPFVMDSNKVKVADASKLDYETDSVFTFKVEVKNCEKNTSTGMYTERCLADTADVQITLKDVNENPEIKCFAGDANCNGPFAVNENSKTGFEIHPFAISDVDARDSGKLTASLSDNGTTGADSLFDVRVSATNDTVYIVVKDSTKLDFEKIKSKHEVVITLRDADGLTDTLIRTINVVDVNEAPEIVDATFTPEENLPNGSVVGELEASDPDVKNVAFSTLTYTIIEGETVPFKLDSNVIKVKDSSKLNYEETPVFTFHVKVTDGTFSDTALVTIKLKDVDESPKIIVDDDDDGDDDTDTLCIAYCDTTDRGHDPVTKNTLTVGVNENSATGTVVFAYVVADEDSGEVKILIPSMRDDNGTGVDSLFRIDLKTEDSKTKLVVSVKDGSKLDYEKVKLLHEVTVFVTDPTGLQDSIVRKIQVLDVNEKPTIADATFTPEENLPNGTAVGKLEASDPDVLNPAFSTLTYKILEGESVPFSLDSNVIKVKDSSKLNYEVTPELTFHVEVSDGSFSDTALVTIKLKDVNETPKIIVDDDDDGDDDTDTLCIAHCDTTDRGHDPVTNKTLTVGVKENSPTGTTVFAYVVADEDIGEVQNLVPTLRDDKASGTDSLFRIDLKKEDGKWKVVVSVKDGAKLDYETIDPIHEVTVIVTDPNGLQDSIKRIIEVLDVNEPPTFESWPFEFVEHNEPGTVVGHVEHGVDVDTTAISGISIPDNYKHDKFELTGGANGADTLFQLLPNGDLIALKTFNFETDPTEYAIYISLMDTLMPELVETDTVWITLLDINEDPWIVTDSVSVEENVKKGTVVDTIEAKDLDLYDTVLTFTLVEDKSDCFEVSKAGVVTVKKDNCPDLDYEKNSELPIKVKVTDSKDASETKTIYVKVKDVNEAPEIEDQTIHVSEDAKIGSVVDTVAASDPDTKTPEYSELTYTIVGGDTSVFKIDPKTGVVTLKDTLDYEEKSEYSLIVEVDDGEFKDTAKVTIKVDNVVEVPDVNITRAETADTSWTNPDTLYINTSDLCIDWMAKNKKSGTVLTDTTECMLLDEGENIIIKKFDDPSMDTPGYDTLVVYVSKATPVVTVRKAVDEEDLPSIFTVVEQSAKADTSFYVNDRSNDIIVTVMDPVSGSTEKFTTKVALDTLSVPSKTFTGTMAGIVDFGLALSDNPGSTTRTPVNGEKVAVTYTEEVNGRTVQVTYYTDNKGEIIKGTSGEAEITISYVAEINGREVTISYQADAVTGAVIKTTGGYAQPESSESSSSDKKGDKKGDKKVENEVVFMVSYETVDETGNVMTISYGVDANGKIVKNEDGNIGYLLSYTYTNKFGNSATQSLFIVLDQVPPEVKIIYPTEGEIVYSNFVDVKWTVDLGDGKGPVVQDTLVTQSLTKGGNYIVRFYRDKAGNEASDTIRVIMKNAKDVDIAIEQPVTEITKDQVAEYYATNEPEEGETFAVTIYNPKTDKEVETIIGGDFDNKSGSGDEPYPGLPGHLGPTLGIETKVPTINAVGGLATLDDIVNKDGLVNLEKVDANQGVKIPVEEYVEKYCTDEFAENVGSDLSRVNLYKTKMYVKIWIYTTLGDFVDYYSFTQDLDNPDYMNDAGLLTLYFEMKPDRDGNVRTASGRLLGTGAYVYRTEVEMKSTLRCSVPPFVQTSGGWEPEKPSNKVGSARSVKEDMLKNFGYKRPNIK